MYNDIFVSYFIPTVNSNPRCDTSCLGPVPPICNSVSGCLRRTRWETLGTTKKRQEQVEHDRVGCRSLGVLLPQRQVGTLLRRGKNIGDSLGRTSVVGLEPHQTWFCFTPSDPRCVTAPLPVICRGFTVLANLPTPLHVIRDKDSGLSYSTSILLASH